MQKLDPADTDIVLATTYETLPEPDANTVAYIGDPAGDEKWFEDHRKAEIRTRAINQLEARAFRFPSITTVVVRRVAKKVTRLYRAPRTAQ